MFIERLSTSVPGLYFDVPKDNQGGSKDLKTSTPKQEMPASDPYPTA